LIDELKLLEAQAEQYPFLNTLTPALEQLEEISGKPYTWYLTELLGQEDALLDLKEQLIDPVRKFMGGPQKEIYSQARAFIQEQEANFAYIKGDEASRIQAVLNDPACFKGNRMQQLKAQLDELKEKSHKKIQEIRSQTISSLNEMQLRMQSMDEYKKLPDSKTSELDSSFQELVNHINQQKLIAVINDRMRYFEEQGYQKLLAKMVDLGKPKPQAVTTTGGEPVSHVAEPEIEYISTRKIHVSFDKAWLADESDVDAYLQRLREALLKEIEAGKRIQI